MKKVHPKVEEGAVVTRSKSGALSAVYAAKTAPHTKASKAGSVGACNAVGWPPFAAAIVALRLKNRPSIIAF
ncbi:hypothetical protein J6590_013955 [Homalodisca vitripennis]|nr:hypothetical protein J6590_013955 [Homalodisca vitripennis]